jgi:hypothetical protein
MAGQANYRITLDMHVGSTAGVLDRARAATEWPGASPVSAEPRLGSLVTSPRA